MTKILSAVLLTLCSLFIALPAYAQRTPEPIIEHLGIPYTTGRGKSVTEAEVRTAIRSAATSLNWSIANGQNAQELVGTLIVRQKHTVQINIRLEPTKYSVTYRDSVNMNYSNSGLTHEDQSLINWRGASFRETSATPVIHPNYNRWVTEFITAVNHQIRAL